jgi:hypothetical protein
MRAALLLSAAATAAAACGSKSGGPTDAPTASLYGAGRFPWADTLVPWTCVFNIKDYPAASADASFALAQAAATSAGGGVIYYPAGTYTFKKMLLLQNNTVIRGAPTTARAKAGKLPGPLAPATRFVCPDRMHMGVLNSDAQAANLGVVNIAFEACSVMLWPALAPYAPPQDAWPGSLKTYWYGAKSVLGAGSRKLVLSNTFSKVAFGSVDPTLPSSNPWAYRFSHAIGLYADAHALAGNNLMPPSPAGPPVTLHLTGDKNSSETQPFPYDLRYGVDNKLLYGAVAGAATGAGGACGGKGWGTLAPDCAPYLFPQDHTVTGNYVYNCGRVAFNIASGCADNAKPTLGSGTQVTDNHSEHCNDGTCWTVDGKNICRGSDTNENRNVDITGYCANISSNSAHVYRQQVAHSQYDTVDGECILAQTENNSPAIAHAWTNNDCTHASASPLATGPIFFYKMITVSDSVVTGNANDAGQEMGAVFDASHNGWVNNVCKGNSQPCKCGSAPCPAA